MTTRKLRLAEFAAATLASASVLFLAVSPALIATPPARPAAVSVQRAAAAGLESTPRTPRSHG